MLDRDKDVQGVAVYAEFRRTTVSGTTMKLFVMPDGYTSEGTMMPAMLYRRVVTEHTPRKQWRRSPFGAKAIEDLGGEPLSDDKAQEWAEQRAMFIDSLFDGLANGQWELVGKPLFVEVSKKDLDDVAKYTTPTKVIYRINQSRAAAGYPAS